MKEKKQFWLEMEEWRDTQRVPEWQRLEVEILKWWFIFTLLFSFSEKASDCSPMQYHGFFCG